MSIIKFRYLLLGVALGCALFSYLQKAHDIAWNYQALTAVIVMFVWGVLWKFTAHNDRAALKAELKILKLEKQMMCSHEGYESVVRCAVCELETFHQNAVPAGWTSNLRFKTLGRKGRKEQRKAKRDEVPVEEVQE
jgi:hypothetical protein